MSACVSTQQLETTSFEKPDQNKKLVPISLFIDDGTYNSGNAYLFDHHIFKRFKESEIFYKVGTQSGAWSYTLLVDFNSTSNNSAADDVAFIASAATLFLLPTKSDFTFTLKVSVVSEGALVKEYRYADV